LIYKLRTISAIADDHHEDEYNNDELNEGYNYDQIDHIDRDLRKEVKELSTKFDTLLITLNMHLKQNLLKGLWIDFPIDLQSVFPIDL